MVPSQPALHLVGWHCSQRPPLIEVEDTHIPDQVTSMTTDSLPDLEWTLGTGFSSSFLPLTCRCRADPEGTWRETREDRRQKDNSSLGPPHMPDDQKHLAIPLGKPLCIGGGVSLPSLTACVYPRPTREPLRAGTLLLNF